MYTLGSQTVFGESVEINGSPEYAKLRREWEMHHSAFGAPGRPYVFRDYPHMMYKPKRKPSGGAEPDFESQVANDELERERLERQGYYFGGKGAALEGLERQESECAELAANRVTTEFGMSEKARTEAEAVDSATIRHLPVIPEANKTSGRRRD